MKTTIKVGGHSFADEGQCVVEPAKAGTGRIWITVDSRLDGPSGVELTQDQAGVLIYALEVAAEAARIAQEREAWGGWERTEQARRRAIREATKG